MFNYKSWYRSTGVLGALVTLFSMVLILLGMHLSSEDWAFLCRQLAALGTAIGGIMSLIGRLKATAAIGKPALITASYVGGTLESIDPPAGIVAEPIPAPQPAAFVAAPVPQTPRPEAPPVQAPPAPQPQTAPQAPAGQ